MPSFLLAINNTVEISIDCIPFESGACLSAEFDPDGADSSSLAADAQTDGLFESDNGLFGVAFEAAILMISGGIELVKTSFPVVTYRCVLTGSADGLSDIIIPISTFQIRKRTV